MARSAILAALVLHNVSIVMGASTGCLVKKYVHLTNTTDTRILSFITLDEHLDFVAEFQDLDVTYWRDWVKVTNSRVTHAKVRDGESSETTDNLPLVFLEGWSNLRLNAVDTGFEVTLLPRGRDEVTLLNLQLDFPVSSVHIEGTFSLCSEDSPEWEVDAGGNVSVSLQPDDSQKLQVTGNGSVYLMVPSTNSDQLEIITNTTLTIKNRRRRSLIEVEVFQDNQEKSTVDVEQRITSPTVLMGCRSGTVHLRLDSSPSTSNNSPPTSNNDSHSAYSSYFLLYLITGCLLLVCFVIGFAAGMMSILLCQRRKAKEAATSVEPVSSGTKQEKSPLV